MWGHRGFPFEGGFLDTLAVNYGAGMRVVDFVADPEAARQAVNKWVAEQTADKIRDILAPGSVTPAMRFVLANAIYFLAAWEDEFDPAYTGPQAFHALAGGTPSVQMMHATRAFGYAAGEGYQAAALPYKGEKLEMVVLLPAAGQYEAFENSLTSQRLGQILGTLSDQQLVLSLPKFAVTSNLDLIPLLKGLGLTAPFSAETADFTGITSQTGLFVAVAKHRAFVTVDEAGTEAGAATVIGGAGTSLPENVMVVDRPFIFLIRDRATGAVLFLGRVTDPSWGPEAEHRAGWRKLRFRSPTRPAYGGPVPPFSPSNRTGPQARRWMQVTRPSPRSGH